MPARDTTNPQDYWPARSSPSQRRHHRLAVPITVVLEARSYPANNWSMGGVLLQAGDRESSQGAQVPAELVLDFQGFVISVRVAARVTRVDAQRGQLALGFEDLGERERALLEYFARGLLGGEMNDVDGVIVRLDMPITPTETLPWGPPARTIRSVGAS